MTTRLTQVQAAMRAERVDFLAIGPGAHMQWLLGFRPHADERPCLLCIGRSRSAFLMPALNAGDIRARTDLPFHEWTDADGPRGTLDRLLGDLDARSANAIVLDETMRADFAALVQDALPDATRRFTETTIGALRLRKDDAEAATLKANAAIADAAMQAGWAAMRPGMRESDVSDIIRAAFADRGARPLFSIVAAGGNGAFPHHQTGGTRLKSGDAVVIDIGGGRDGYVSDMTRMAVIGTPPPGYAEIHAVVESAVQAALAVARPGVRAAAVDQAARDVIARAGYGDFFVHRTGHGLGVEIHEPPYITSTSETVLDQGMVFSIEPGIYLPGRFGVRLEDIVILRPDGPEILSALPRGFRTIET